MTKKTSILPLLQSIIKDNISYKFPVEYINRELLNMFMEPIEFDYFRMMCYRKLRKEYGDTIAHIFLQVLEQKMELNMEQLHTIPLHTYQERIERVITSLENLYITKIDKNSPDGEMMSAMV